MTQYMHILVLKGPITPIFHVKDNKLPNVDWDVRKDILYQKQQKLVGSSFNFSDGGIVLF